MTRIRIHAVLATLFVALLLPARPASAGQEQGNWEFSLHGGETLFDSSDPLAVTKSALFDLDGDGTAETTRVFRRSLDIPDDSFAGLRLGFSWSRNLGTEVSYDRNHASGDFVQTVDSLPVRCPSQRGGCVPQPGASEQDLHGTVGAIFTSYQIGVLYHPFGNRNTPWQPFVTLAAGWMDVDFEPSDSVEKSATGGAAGGVFRTDLERGDHSLMAGFGIGLKYFLKENIAIRGDVRAKSYDLFDDKRTDREISIGISFFVPGGDY